MDPLSRIPDSTAAFYAAMQSTPSLGNLGHMVLGMNLNTQQMIGAIATGQAMPQNLFQGLEAFAGQATPQAPSLALFQQFSQMQAQFQQQEASAGESVVNDTESLREALFTTQHYEFGANGVPELREGAETFDQRRQRLQWEREQERNARASFEGERQALQQAQAQLMEQARTGRIDYRAMEALQKRELELTIRTEVAALMSKLPPGARDMPPDSQARQLYDFATNGIDEVLAMRAEHERILETSEAGRAIRQFYESTRNYINNLPARPAAFDPDAMRNMGRNMGLL